MGKGIVEYMFIVVWDGRLKLKMWGWNILKRIIELFSVFYFGLGI